MALRGHKNECGKCQPGFYLEFQRNLFWKMRSQILVLYSNLWPVSLRKMGERSNKIHGLLLFQPLFLQLSTKTIHMTSRQPCYCSQTIKFPTLGKWFLFFLKVFFLFKCESICLRQSFLTFFRSPHDFPTFLFLILCLWRYGWTFCTSRNTKVRKVTNTCIIQDSNKFFDVELKTSA